jgi:hypothetical protein
MRLTNINCQPHEIFVLTLSKWGFQNQTQTLELTEILTKPNEISHPIDSITRDLSVIF